MSKSEKGLLGPSNSHRTDFSIETLLRKDPPSIITINIGESCPRIGGRERESLPVESLSDHSQSQLQFHSDQDDSEMTNLDDDEMEREEDDSRYLSMGQKDNNIGSTFSWLHCTRFKPPKLPRKSI